MTHNISLLQPGAGTAPADSDGRGGSPPTTTAKHNALTPDRIVCRRCDTAQSGGFDPDLGILLCANHFRNRGHMEDTLAHELVHAYDFLRFKVDNADLRHAACMEVGSSLSGAVAC